MDRPCTVPPCLLASSRQESNEEEDENEEPANPAGNRIRTRGGELRTIWKGGLILEYNLSISRSTTSAKTDSKFIGSWNGTTASGDSTKIDGRGRTKAAKKEHSIEEFRRQKWTKTGIPDCR